MNNTKQNTYLLAKPRVIGVGVLVKDAEQAHAAALNHGARSVLSPVTLTDPTTGQQQTVAEVVLYGDVILRLVSGPYQVRTITYASIPKISKAGA